MSRTKLSKDTPSKIQTVELDWFAEADNVRVTPRNQKRFEIQKDWAIKILQVAEEHKSTFRIQLELLLDVLAKWVHGASGEVDIAYLTWHDTSFLFIAVCTSPEFNEDFEDSLSELDFEIANDADLSMIRLHAISLPHVSVESLSSFIDEHFALSYHGHRE